MSLAARVFAGLLAALLFVLTPSGASAQDDLIDIEVGKSKVKEFSGRVTAVAITDPKVARIQPLASTNRYQIQGIAVGTTDLIVTIEGSSRPLVHEIVVHRDLSDLIRRIDAIVEGEPPRVYPLGENIVVQGPVDDLDTLEQVAMVASVFDEKFVNLMSVRGDHQVQLEVVFAETSRSGLRGRDRRRPGRRAVPWRLQRHRHGDPADRLLHGAGDPRRLPTDPDARAAILGRALRPAGRVPRRR